MKLKRSLTSGGLDDIIKPLDVKVLEVETTARAKSPLANILEVRISPAIIIDAIIFTSKFFLDSMPGTIAYLKISRIVI